MTDTNGWPDPSKPGVPMNPERDGWHWVDRPMHGVLPMQWLEIAGGGWVGKHTCLTALEATKAGWLYVGPCHTPAEVAALIEAARREEREACAEEAIAAGSRHEHLAHKMGWTPTIQGALKAVVFSIRARGDA